MAGIPPYERPVNMMFQSYALFPHLTVEKNVAFGLRQNGLPGAEINKRVDEFFSNRDWPVASAVAIVILLLLVVPMMFYQHFQAREAETAS